jgi:hypothetical protein
MESQELMSSYSRLKFHDHMNERDPQVISTLLKEGAEEVDRMDFYHSLYERKKRQLADASPLDSAAPLGLTLAKQCIACQIDYPSAEAKFCSHCGVKRPMQL